MKRVEAEARGSGGEEVGCRLLRMSTAAAAASSATPACLPAAPCPACPYLGACRISSLQRGKVMSLYSRRAAPAVPGQARRECRFRGQSLQGAPALAATGGTRRLAACRVLRGRRRLLVAPVCYAATVPHPSALTCQDQGIEPERAQVAVQVERRRQLRPRQQDGVQGHAEAAAQPTGGGVSLLSATTARGGGTGLQRRRGSAQLQWAAAGPLA